MPQQRRADEVRRPAPRRADAEVDARLPKIQGPKLRVRIGDVQQADVAERAQRLGIEALAVGVVGRRARERQSRRDRGRKRLEGIRAASTASG